MYAIKKDTKRFFLISQIKNEISSTEINNLDEIFEIIFSYF